MTLVCTELHSPESLQVIFQCFSPDLTRKQVHSLRACEGKFESCPKYTPKANNPLLSPQKQKHKNYFILKVILE